MDVFSRMKATLNGEKRDRIPYVLALSLYGSKLIGALPEFYYKDSELYFKGQKKAFDLFAPDIILSPFALVLEGQAFGSKIKNFVHQPPNIIEHYIKNINEIKKIRLPDIKKDFGIQYILESIKRMSDFFKDKAYIASTVSSPTDLPILIMGMDLWLEIILFHKDLMYNILDITKSFFKDYVNEIINSGSNIIVIPTTFCNPTFLPAEYIEKYMLPVIEDCIKDIDCIVIIHHGGLKIEGAVPFLQKLSKVEGYVIDFRDDFREIRKTVGSDKILLGNLNGAFLNKNSNEIIKVKSNKIIEYMEEDNKTIFATSGADIPLITDKKQIASIIETIERFEYNYAYNKR